MILGSYALAVVTAAISLPVLLLSIYNRRLSRKYRNAVTKRGDPTKPLSELQPVPSNVPAAKRLFRDGPQTRPECFKNALELDIVVYTYPPSGQYAGKDPKAVILYVSGLDCCGEADLSVRGRIGAGLGYVGSWFELFCDAGYTLITFDFNGMGHSESVLGSGQQRSMCYDYEDYVDETLALRRLLGARYPGEKIVLMGGSMGACVGLNAAERCPDLFDACVFFCPAVYFETLKKMPKNKVLLPLLSLLSKHLPWLRLADKATPSLALKEEEARVGLPYFNVANMPARYAEHGLKYGERAAEGAPALTMPLLLLHSKDDCYTDFQGSEILMERAGTEDKTLYDDLDGMDHALVHSDCVNHRRKHGKRIVKWLDERVKAVAAEKTKKGKAATPKRAASSPGARQRRP